MEIYITLESTEEVGNKLQIAFDKKIEAFFKDKTYSDDLTCLYIAMFCMNSKFAAFFPLRKNKYTAVDKKYTYKGVDLEKKAGTFEYELRLDFEQYNKTIDIREMLAQDIISSLDIISTCKKIERLNLEGFKADFELLFKELEWL